MFGSPFTPYAHLNGRTRTIVVIAELIGVILLWQCASLWSVFIPGPLDVLTAVGRQINERGVLYELFVSLWLNMQAVAIALVAAFLLAYSYVLPFMRPIAQFIARLRYFGIIGISFFFQLFISDSHWVKVSILVFGLLPYLAAPLIEEVSSIDESRFNHARTLKLSHLGTTWEVVVLGRLYEMIEVVRQNAAIAWMMVATVEGMIRSGGGVGVMLVEQAKYLRMADILAILSLIFIIGILQDLVIRWIGKLLCPYATLNERSM